LLFSYSFFFCFFPQISHSYVLFRLKVRVSFDLIIGESKKSASFLIDYLMIHLIPDYNYC